MSWAADGSGGIHRDHMTDDEIVEEHPNRCQMLLDARRAVRLSQRLDVCGDNRGREPLQGNLSLLAPRREAFDSDTVRLAGVSVPDVRGEELDVTATRIWPGVNKELWGQEFRRRREVVPLRNGSKKGQSRGGSESVSSEYPITSFMG